MITPFPPSPTPEINPNYPFRSPQILYWYYPYPLGHEPKHEVQEALTRYYDLEFELKPLVNGDMKVLPALQVLDELTYTCPIAFSSKALAIWMHHAQRVITALKMHAFRCSLRVEERNLIVFFALYWLQKRGGACCMGRPEAQIVIYTMLELAQ